MISLEKVAYKKYLLKSLLSIYQLKMSFYIQKTPKRPFILNRPLKGPLFLKSIVIKGFGD